MLFAALYAAALVLAVAASVTAARRGSRHLAALVRTAEFGFALAGIVAAGSRDWAAFAVSLVALLVFALLDLTSRDDAASSTARDCR